MTATTRTFDPTALENTLCMSLELGEGRWKVTSSVGFGSRILRWSVAARDGEALLRRIAWAKERLGLDAEARVMSCYEAGRDGFWLHRFLAAHGVENLVVDSSSIEVSRRKRRAKTDRLDGESLLDLLLRHLAGRTCHRRTTGAQDKERLRYSGYTCNVSVHPNSLKNLRPAKPGEVRNPEGINGMKQRRRFEAVADAYLEETDSKLRARFRRKLLDEWLSGALAGDSRLLFELVRRIP